MEGGKVNDKGGGTLERVTERAVLEKEGSVRRIPGGDDGDSPSLAAPCPKYDKGLTLT